MLPTKGSAPRGLIVTNRRLCIFDHIVSASVAPPKFEEVGAPCQSMSTISLAFCCQLLAGRNVRSPLMEACSGAICLQVTAVMER